ncbi:hypothetical protein, partial [Staphylococcus condimenti]|uniref:hypothetical protein n=1 Tax=Staphylococcus condimenti TaxID=70255 RepID=UPI0013EE4571
TDMENNYNESQKLLVNVECIDMINYSLVQNDFQLIKNIQLLNEGEEELRDLKIKIYSLSGSIYEYIKDIPVIEAENELNIADPEVEYNYDYYRNVVERIK